MNPNVSVDVLITFYNQEQYVDRTLQSVLGQQTEVPVNIIIGDDGSSDGTVNRIQMWCEKYPNISCFIMERDASKKYEAIERVSALRKELLSRTKGTYVLFLDGDDYYSDNKKIQKQVEILESNTDCVCCGHNFNLVWEDVNKIERALPFVNETKISNKMYWKNYFIHAMCFMFRNITKAQIPNELQDVFFDDNSISLFFIQYGNIYYLPECMCNYTQVAGSSWDDRNEIERHIINALDYYEECVLAHNMRFYALLRHATNFLMLYKNRSNMKTVNLKQVWTNKIEYYGKETYLYQVFHYDELQLSHKLKLFVLTIGICFLIVYRKVSKLFGRRL